MGKIDDACKEVVQKVDGAVAARFTRPASGTVQLRIPMAKGSHSVFVEFQCDRAVGKATLGSNILTVVVP